MQKYKGYLICTDIDGTLVNSKGELTENNLNAIRHFQQNGGLFTVATGRMSDYVLNFPFLPNAPVVAINGTVIYDLAAGRILRDFPIESDYDDIIEYIYENHFEHLKNYEAYCFEKYILSEKQPLVEMIEQLKSFPALKFLFRMHTPDKAAAMSQDLNSKFGDRFTFDRSWPFGLEMHIKGSGKGDCVKLLKDEFCSGVHTVIAIGDYENDISMIKEADIGFATENAPDSVKKYADRIAPSNDDDAISYVIQTLT